MEDNVDLCYCNDVDKERHALPCKMCGRIYHPGCLKSGRPSPLIGDVFYELVCSYCAHNKTEEVKRQKIPWVLVVSLTLYNLSLECKTGCQGFFRWKEHICTFIDRHWVIFFGKNKLKPNKWQGTVAGALSQHANVYFMSGSRVLSETGWWQLKDGRLPSLTEVTQKKCFKKAKKTENSEIDVQNIILISRSRSKEIACKRKKKSEPAKQSKVCKQQAALSDGPEEVASCSLSPVASDAKEPSSSEEIMKLLHVDDDLDIDPCSMSPPAHRTPLIPLTSLQDPLPNLDEILADYKGGSIDDPFLTCSTPLDWDKNEKIGTFDFEEPKSLDQKSVIVKQEPDEGPKSVPESAGNVVRKSELKVKLEDDDSGCSEAEDSKEPERRVEEEGPKVRLCIMSLMTERKLLALLQSRKQLCGEEARLRCKLRLRKLKRERSLPVFNLDAELQKLTGSVENSEPPGATIDGVQNILDRFQSAGYCRPLNRRSQSFLTRLVGSDEGRQHMIKSPFTHRMLKPYIRRDFECRPLKLQLLEEIVQRQHESDLSWKPPATKSVDYCYVRPEHIPSINAYCGEFFWPGIDLTETLQYPDFSCVALYKKLVIGFIFMVPDVSHSEAYISFLFTHPEWRRAGIATFMIYHIIQTCMGKDITLHVSASNPAMILYQKFGFKPEQFVLDFYDKFLPENSKEFRHAFFLRLHR